MRYFIALALLFSPAIAHAGIAGLPTGTPGTIAGNITLHEELGDVKSKSNPVCNVSKGSKVKLITGYEGYKVVKVKAKSCTGWTHSSNFLID